MSFDLSGSSGQSGNCFRSFTVLLLGFQPGSETVPAEGILMSSGKSSFRESLPFWYFPSGPVSRTGPPDGLFSNL